MEVEVAGAGEELEELDCREDFALLWFVVETCLALFSGLSAEVWLLAACPQPARSPKRQRDAARKAVSFIALPCLFNVLFPFMTSPFLCYQKVI